MFQKPVSVLIESYHRFSQNNQMAHAAAIAYYAAFSLPSMLLILISLVGFFVEPQDVRGEINRNIENIAGKDAAEQVEEIIIAANKPRENLIATVIGGGMLLIGSTGVLFQLQTALNHVWQVTAKPDSNNLLAFVLKRIMSLSMLLVFAFLLVVTISMRAAMAEMGAQLDALLPATFTSGMMVVVNQIVGFIMMMLLLAAMFRFLPDARVPWRSVWFGALITTLLFSVGQQVMAYYLSTSNPGEVYGAAGSLVIILIWVYYASIIVLFGAQLNQTWSSKDGLKVEPEQHAEAEKKIARKGIPVVSH
jgi:membrane protein